MALNLECIESPAGAKTFGYLISRQGNSQAKQNYVIILPPSCCGNFQNQKCKTSPNKNDYCTEVKYQNRTFLKNRTGRFWSAGLQKISKA